MQIATNVSTGEVFFSPFLVGKNNLICFYLIMSYHEGGYDIFLHSVGDLKTSA